MATTPARIVGPSENLAMVLREAADKGQVVQTDGKRYLMADSLVSGFVRYGSCPTAGVDFIYESAEVFGKED